MLPDFVGRPEGPGPRETCHNDLFNMISNLDTVRSALEISELTQERLVHLGSVLTRFNNEGLDTILTRTFGIASRAGLMPEAPPELEGKELSVQYVGVLAEAQRAKVLAELQESQLGPFCRPCEPTSRATQIMPLSKRLPSTACFRVSYFLRAALDRPILCTA